MKKNTILLFLNFLFLTFFVACTNKNPQKTVNESEKPHQLVATQKTEPIVASGSNSGDDSQITRLEQNKDVAGLAALIETNFEIAMKDDSVESQKALAQVNKAMVALAQVDLTKLSGLKDGKIAARYIQELTMGCDVKFSGCKRLSHFQKDMNTASVLTYLAKTDMRWVNQGVSCSKTPSEQKALSEYYCLLNITFEIKNRVPDQDLSKLYLLKANEYAQLLKKTDEGAYDRFTKVLQLILINYDFSAASESDKKVLEIFAPWNFSEQNNSDIKGALRKATGNNSANFLYVDGSSQLNPEFKAVIERIMDVSDMSGKSFRSKVTEITEDKKLKQILADLNVETGLMQQDFFNEYFYIIDRLFRDHLTANSAGNIWKQTKKNTPLFLKILDFYIKVELIHKIFETQDFMKNLFESKDSQRSNAIILMIERSKEMTIRWVHLMNRIEKMGDFVSGYIQVGYESASDVKSFLDMMKIIRRNLKMITTGPMTMIMAHFMALNDSKLIFYDYYGYERKIDSQTILSLFYDVSKNQSQLGTWLKFGNDSYDLNLVEMVYSFTFAVLTQTFEIFGGSDFAEKPNFGANASRIKFLEILVEKVMTPYKIQLTKYRDTLKVANPLFNNALSNCEMARQNRTPAINIDYADLGRFLMYGNSSYGDIKGIEVGIIDSLGNGSATGSGETNTYSPSELPVYRSKMMFVESLIEIAALEADHKMTNPDSLKMYKERLTKILGPYYGLEKEIIAMITDNYAKVSNCISLMAIKENEVQIESVAQEKKHLAEVWDTFDRLSKYATAAEREKAYDAETKSLQFDDSKDHDSITNTHYRMSKYDYYNRLERFVKSKGINVTKPDPDLITMKSTPEYQPIPFVDRGVVIPKEEFIRLGIRALASATTHMTPWNTWVGKSANNSHLIKKVQLVNLLITLRFFDERLFSDSKVRKITVDDLINSYLELAHFSRLSPNQLSQLQDFNFSTKFSEVSMASSSGTSLNNLDSLYINSATEEQRYILDTALEELIKATEVKKMTQDYYNSVMHMGDFLFKPRIAVEEAVLDKKYKPLYLSSQNLIASFIKSAQTQAPQFFSELSVDKQGKEIVIPLYFEDRGKNIIKYYSKSKTELISPILIKKFEDEQATFLKTVPKTFLEK